MTKIFAKFCQCARAYDADNRIVETYTNSRTPMMAISRPNYDLENELTFNVDWENDAKYFYYAHGPLARTEIGDKQLQGFDYLYNLQGWMKGINAIENTNDPGKDGAAGVNSYFGKDLTAFSLTYFNNDYSLINASAPIASVDNSSHAANNSSQLFNGNIRYMQTRLTNPNTRTAMPMLNAYKYDQLNRLSESRSYESGLNSSAWNPTTYANEYYNAFTFDGMGNILTQKRHKRDGTAIEDMTYHYQYEDPTNQERLMRNRLFHINDAIAANVDATDIDDMGTFDADIEDINVNNNYSYDEEGRLVRDNQEGISKIVWRVDGKVKEIQRVGEDKKYLRFDYDAMGHRIAKHVYNNTGITLEKSTYYILDAQGNQVSMYEHVVENETVKYNLVENNIFGSSRIGNLNREMNVLNASISSGGTQVLGKKFYEFTNHLGNVLTVFSDLKIPQDTDNNNLVDNYLLGIVRSVDYSPFGVELDGRTIAYEPPTPPAPSATEIYKNSFDTPEATTNPYTGTTTTLDSNLTTTGWSRPSGTFTNFNGVSGTKAIAFVNASSDTNYVHLNLSVNAGYVLDVTSYSFFHRSSPTGYNAYKLVINGIEVGSGSIFVSSGSTLQSTGTVNVSNTISGLSGNVTVTLKLFGGQKGTQGTFRMDDFILNGFTQSTENAEILAMRGYRYGFQNQEKDDELKGEGNSVNYKFRMHDPRVGRFFSRDSKEQIYNWQSTYVFASNNPIKHIDFNGEGIDDPKTKSTTVISSDIDKGNAQNISMTKILEKVTVSDNIRKTQITISTVQTTISPYKNVEDKSTNVKVVNYTKTEEWNSAKGIWVQNFEQVNTFETTMEKSQFSTKDKNNFHSWVSYISDYNKSNDVPYNKYIQDRLKNGVLKAMDLGALPFFGVKTPLSKFIPEKLRKKAGAVGLPTSTNEVLGLVSDHMMTENNFMIHSIRQVDNSKVIKQAKSPTSKDDENCGPASFQDLFDGNKWSEWWNGTTH